MNIFVEALSTKEFFTSLKGVDESVVEDAEKKLGTHFSREYKEYLLKYGIASIKGHEFLGLGSSNRLSVVDNTIQERAYNQELTTDYYIVENIGMDSVLIAQDSKGRVYEVRSNCKPNLIADSLSEYINCVCS